jgi:UDP-glucose-4-epimerase GalE
MYKKISLYLVLFLCALVQPTFCTEKPVVLVTGGAGYIGSHACKLLSEAGFTPVTFDSLELGDANSVKWGPLFVGNLLDIDALDRAFAEYKPTAVLHFAALKKVGESVQNPAIYYQNNVSGSINLLNAMIKHKVKNIVFSSTCAVYGTIDSGPIDELNPCSPDNPYGMSKRMVELVIQDYAKAYDINYAILRYFNVVGMDLDAGFKRSIHTYGSLVPIALLSLVNPKAPLNVFGTDFPTPDGSAIRDYIHIKDLARAHVLALNYLQKDGKSEVINLGTGKGSSVLEVIQMIEKVSKKSVPHYLVDRRKGDVAEAVANAKKAGDILGFEAECSDLQSIIENEWESIQKEAS